MNKIKVLISFQCNYNYELRLNSFIIYLKINTINFKGRNKGMELRLQRFEDI